MKRNISLIILFDSQKRVLLQHRSDNAERLPGYWGFFGGGIRAGEKPETTVRREALEELGYRLVNPRLVITQKIKVPDEGLKYVFIERYDSAKELLLGEGQGMEWFDICETEKLNMIKHDIEALECVKRSI